MTFLKVGVCDIEKKNDISIFGGIFSITIIRRYFAECVIVLISDYRAQFHLSLNRFLPFNKAIFF